MNRVCGLRFTPLGIQSARFISRRMTYQTLIDNQRTKVAEMRSQLAIAEAELRGMQKMAAAFEPQEPPTAAAPLITPVTTLPEAVVKAFSARRSEAGAVGGKPVGSISMKWRKVLASFYRDGARFSDTDVVLREKAINGRDVRARAVRRLFDGYVSHGFLTRDSNGEYQVTNSAAERFGFTRLSAEQGSNEAGLSAGSGNTASSLFSSQEGGEANATAT